MPILPRVVTRHYTVSNIHWFSLTLLVTVFQYCTYPHIPHLLMCVIVLLRTSHHCRYQIMVIIPSIIDNSTTGTWFHPFLHFLVQNGIVDGASLVRISSASNACWSWQDIRILSTSVTCYLEDKQRIMHIALPVCIQAYKSYCQVCVSPVAVSRHLTHWGIFSLLQVRALHEQGAGAVGGGGSDVVKQVIGATGQVDRRVAQGRCWRRTSVKP